MESSGGGRKDKTNEVKTGFCLTLFQCGDRGATVIQFNRAAVQKPPPFKMPIVESYKLPVTLGAERNIEILKSCKPPDYSDIVGKLHFSRETWN